MNMKKYRIVNESNKSYRVEKRNFFGWETIGAFSAIWKAEKEVVKMVAEYE